MSSEEPRNEIETAADEAMQAAHDYLENEGIELKRMFILIESETTRGEPNSVTAGCGIEGASELIAFVIAWAIEAGAQIGIEIKVAKLGRG